MTAKNHKTDSKVNIKTPVWQKKIVNIFFLKCGWIMKMERTIIVNVVLFKKNMSMK